MKTGMPLDQDRPITLWFQNLQSGDDEAAAELWEHFVDRLRGVLRDRLHRDTRRTYDEDDAAQSAFHSLYRGVRNGKFTDLQDRESLWRMLVAIASNKVLERHRFDRRERRDVRRTSTESGLARADEPILSLDEATALALSPELTTEFVDTYESLFERLTDDMQRTIVALKLEGCSVVEIAGQLGCTRKTVHRKMKMIQLALQNLLEPTHQEDT
jgi:RNA polymerase sigma factor (sigma-70 family)